MACLLAASATHAHVLSAGFAHTCTIDAGGGVQCWGYNGNGQLGDGSTDSPRTLPVRATNLDSGIVAVAATSRERSCALRGNGEVLCWGANGAGELGDGTTIDRLIPTPVNGLGPGSGVTMIALGFNHACALRSDGAVLCWGNNSSGQLGTGTTSNVPVPTTHVFGLGAGSGTVAIAAGETHTCALKTDQSVYCWGGNGDGALGDSTTIDHVVPLPVATLGAGSGAVDISAGRNYSCATRNEGSLLCWGRNSYGQLGDGTTTTALLPKLILGTGGGAIEVSGMYNHTCARTGAGVLCWGTNTDGQLGDGSISTDHYSPVAVQTLGADMAAVAAGAYHSCARKSSGTVLCWGGNFGGQLGIGELSRGSVMPVVVKLNDPPIFRNGFD